MTHLVTTLIPPLPECGWLCPCCRTIWAPKVDRCSCQRGGGLAVAAVPGVNPSGSSVTATSGGAPQKAAGPAADARAMIRSELRRAIDSGAADRMLRSSFGLRPEGEAA